MSKVKQYRYILFDWDGTLAKTLDIWLNALRVSLEKRGHFLDDKDIGANYESFKKYFETQGHTDVDKIIEEALSEADGNIPSVELYPHAIEVLQYLRNSHKELALVTTSWHKHIDPLLQTRSVGHLFSAVVCGDDTERIKPDAEPIRKAVSDLNGDYKQTIIVGDSESDIRAAANAGIDSILFYPPDHEKFHNIDALRLLKPTHIVHDLREITRLLV